EHMGAHPICVRRLDTREFPLRTPPVHLKADARAAPLETRVEDDQLLDAELPVERRDIDVVLLLPRRHDLQREARDDACLPYLPEVEAFARRHTREHVDVGSEDLLRVVRIPPDVLICAHEGGALPRRDLLLDLRAELLGDEPLERTFPHIVLEWIVGGLA